MSFHSDTLSRFRANHSLKFLLNIACISTHNLTMQGEHRCGNCTRKTHGVFHALDIHLPAVVMYVILRGSTFKKLCTIFILWGARGFLFCHIIHYVYYILPISLIHTIFISAIAISSSAKNIVDSQESVFKITRFHNNIPLIESHGRLFVPFVIRSRFPSAFSSTRLANKLRKYVQNLFRKYYPDNDTHNKTNMTKNENITFRNSNLTPRTIYSTNKDDMTHEVSLNNSDVKGIPVTLPQTDSKMAAELVMGIPVDLNISDLTNQNISNINLNSRRHDSLTTKNVFNFNHKFHRKNGERKHSQNRTVTVIWAGGRYNVLGRNKPNVVSKSIVFTAPGHRDSLKSNNNVSEQHRATKQEQRNIWTNKNFIKENRVLSNEGLLRNNRDFEMIGITHHTGIDDVFRISKNKNGRKLTLVSILGLNMQDTNGKHTQKLVERTIWDGKDNFVVWQIPVYVNNKTDSIKRPRQKGRTQKHQPRSFIGNVQTRNTNAETSKLKMKIPKKYKRTKIPIKLDIVRKSKSTYTDKWKNLLQDTQKQSNENSRKQVDANSRKHINEESRKQINDNSRKQIDGNSRKQINEESRKQTNENSRKQINDNSRKQINGKVSSLRSNDFSDRTTNDLIKVKRNKLYTKPKIRDKQRKVERTEINGKQTIKSITKYKVTDKTVSSIVSYKNSSGADTSTVNHLDRTPIKISVISSKTDDMDSAKPKLQMDSNRKSSTKNQNVTSSQDSKTTNFDKEINFVLKRRKTVNRKRNSKIFHDIMNDRIYSPHPRTNDGEERFLKIVKHSATSNSSNYLTKGPFGKLKTRLHDLMNLNNTGFKLENNVVQHRRVPSTGSNRNIGSPNKETVLSRNLVDNEGIKIKHNSSTFTDELRRNKADSNIKRNISKDRSSLNGIPNTFSTSTFKTDNAHKTTSKRSRYKSKRKTFLGRKGSSFNEIHHKNHIRISKEREKVNNNKMHYNVKTLRHAQRKLPTELSKKGDIKSRFTAKRIPSISMTDSNNLSSVQNKDTKRLTHSKGSTIKMKLRTNKFSKDSRTSENKKRRLLSKIMMSTEIPANGNHDVVSVNKKEGKQSLHSRTEMRINKKRKDENGRKSLYMEDNIKGEIQRPNVKNASKLSTHNPTVIQSSSPKSNHITGRIRKIHARKQILLNNHATERFQKFRNEISVEGRKETMQVNKSELNHKSESTNTAHNEIGKTKSHPSRMKKDSFIEEVIPPPIIIPPNTNLYAPFSNRGQTLKEQGASPLKLPNKISQLVPPKIILPKTEVSTPLSNSEQGANEQVVHSINQPRKVNQLMPPIIIPVTMDTLMTSKIIPGKATIPIISRKRSGLLASASATTIIDGPIRSRLSDQLLHMKTRLDKTNQSTKNTRTIYTSTDVTINRNRFVNQLKHSELKADKNVYHTRPYEEGKNDLNKDSKILVTNIENARKVRENESRHVSRSYNNQRTPNNQLDEDGFTIGTEDDISALYDGDQEDPYISKERENNHRLHNRKTTLYNIQHSSINRNTKQVKIQLEASIEDSDMYEYESVSDTDEIFELDTEESNIKRVPMGVLLQNDPVRTIIRNAKASYIPNKERPRNIHDMHSTNNLRVYNTVSKHSGSRTERIPLDSRGDDNTSTSIGRSRTENIPLDSRSDYNTRSQHPRGRTENTPLDYGSDYYSDYSMEYENDDDSFEKVHEDRDQRRDRKLNPNTNRYNYHNKLQRNIQFLSGKYLRLNGHLDITPEHVESTHTDSYDYEYESDSHGSESDDYYYDSQATIKNDVNTNTEMYKADKHTKHIHRSLAYDNLYSTESENPWDESAEWDWGDCDYHDV